MPYVIRLTTPLDDNDVSVLKSGDSVLLNGIIYTGRDAAHKRLVDAVRKDQKLPFDVRGQVIYYVGPSPAKPGQVIGSAGPTTSYRMDSYAPVLIKLGLKGMIGKGPRGDAKSDLTPYTTKEAMREYNAVYFGAIGGAGALISKCIISSEIIAYEDLGPEAIRKLEVVDFPVTVINDSHGCDLYEEGIAKYRIA